MDMARWLGPALLMCGTLTPACATIQNKGSDTVLMDRYDSLAVEFSAFELGFRVATAPSSDAGFGGDLFKLKLFFASAMGVQAGLGWAFASHVPQSVNDYADDDSRDTQCLDFSLGLLWHPIILGAPLLFSLDYIYESYMVSDSEGEHDCYGDGCHDSDTVAFEGSGVRLGVAYAFKEGYWKPMIKLSYTYIPDMPGTMESEPGVDFGFGGSYQYVLLGVDLLNFSSAE